MVTLEEMKNYLRVDYGDDDALIEGMISAAVKQCMDILRTSWSSDMPSAAVGGWRHNRTSPPQSRKVSKSWRKKFEKHWRDEMEKLLSILDSIGIPYAYDHFAEGESPEPPFLCYLLPGSDNFSADGKVYHKISEVRLELYTDYKDLASEQKVEDTLDAAGLFYNKTETWIDSEKLYEVLYSFDMEGM